MSDGMKHKLPTELTAEILASNMSGKGIPGDTLAQDFETLFKKIEECRKKESTERGELIV